MKLLERMRGTDGIKIIVGSAFFWAWLDAMFMSMFFVRPGSRGLMAEAAVVAVFAVSAIGFSFALRLLRRSTSCSANDGFPCQLRAWVQWDRCCSCSQA